MQRMAERKQSGGSLPGGQQVSPDQPNRQTVSAASPEAGFSPTTSAAAISVRNLSVSFGDSQVLKNVNIEVPNCAVTAIIGPSGCGKSTFLRSINRLHDLVPTAKVQGEVLLFGQNILGKGVEAIGVRRRVGMVFQKSNPFPTMSVVENVTVGLRLNGISDRSVLAQRAKEALSMAALWEEVKDRLKAPAISLSGGQQQRLCIARALAVKPEVLLMDEPASALDPLATSRIEDLILDLKQKYTIVVVTHNMQQAARISDFTGFFYLGELVEYGTTSKMFSHPDKRRTEDYVTGRFG
jgi:phosphate transport system ATP-binding protein